MEKITSYLGWKVDFANPPGEPAFCAPDSVHWRVYKNTVALAIGGVAAVLMEFADARIRSGVWDHSVYPQDPLGRSQRTGMAAMVGVFGPRSAARRVIQGVTNMHACISGETPAGQAYRALDPDLLDWVSATAQWGFLTAYDRFVAPVSDADKTRYFSEGVEAARLYGVQNPIRSEADFLAMMDTLSPGFEPHPINAEFLDIIRSGKAAPQIPKALHRAMAHASVSILPHKVRAALGLGKDYDLGLAGRLAVNALGKLADRTPVRHSPASDASIRLGLPWNYPWKSSGEQARLLRAAPAPTSAPAE